MSTTIDRRVVEMQFNNQQFERNVSTSMSTLDKLKQSLNLTGASKGFENINSAAKGLNLSGVSSAIETMTSRFSALEVMGVTALVNITNQAVNAGKRIASALTIDPIKTGFQEYETQINAVQTILANTESKGTTLTDVNKALDTLNTYADKTIYNFTEMTRNIGTFTAAGVDLDTSVKSIQGIANLAAVSGSTSQQASTAMYQLSQALAAGKVSLMDWNSVVNAGMGGQVFQDALKRTSEAMGTGAEAAIKKYGSFRESLTKGEWLTTDVLTKTLEQFTMAAEEGSEQWEKYKKSLMDDGYTAKQAEEILKMANTATNAATKVKTFTQLWDTLKEAAQSGWTQTWEILVGDFEEAKSMLTNVSDVLNEMIGKSAEARNGLLQGWKKLGGRDNVINAVKNAFEGILNIVNPIKEAFREVFPPVTVKNLLHFSRGLEKVSKLFKEFTEANSDKIKTIFKGIFSAASLAAKAFGLVAKAVGALLASDGFKKLVDLVVDITVAIAEFFTAANEGFNAGGLEGGLSNLVNLVSDLLSKAVDGIRNFGDAFSKIGDFIVKVAKTIWGGIETVFTYITEHVSAGDIFAGLAGGGIFVALKKFGGLFEKIQDILDGFFGKDDGDSLKDKFGDILDSVHDSLNSFATGIKVGSLVAIAVAVGILSASLNTISKLELKDISKGLFAIGALLVMLNLSFRSITKSIDKFDVKGIVKSGGALILISAAINILADAMIKISKLSLAEIGKGLVGVGVGLVELCLGLKAISKVKVSLSTSVAILVLAESCKILADALTKFGKMAWDEIGRGLTAMGGALGELVIAMGVLNKFSGGSSILGSAGVFITVQSLGELADGLKKFGSMAWEEIGKGLAAMGGALGEVAIITGALGKLSGFSSIFGAGGIVIVIQGLNTLADALKKYGSMAWDEIGRGLTAMGGAVAEIAIATGVLGKLAGFSGIFGSGAILIVIQGLSEMADALAKFGAMAWEEIGKGLVGMGGALAEVAGITGALGKLAGFSGIIGSGAILITIQGLGELADAFKKFGEMTWDEIGKGLVGMGAALIEVGGITGVLGYLAGLPTLLGGGAILLAVQGLGDIADALKKFGEMSWDEIGKGLTAMGAALGEIALGGVLNTFSIIGSYSISEVAEPLGVLADSVKKWSGVTVPENLGWQLMTLADGVFAFTLDGLGASAIADVAKPLGDLAISVQKWHGVTVPEGIGQQLASLADGVGEFTFGGLGASAIADIGKPLGDLAVSVSKWKNVKVPEGLENQLKEIANGIGAFSFAFMGGWSLDTIIEPLGALAASVKKWNGVKVPKGLEEDLKGLADAVQAFTWAFVGGWSIDAIKGPLGDLAASVKKWNGVTIPDDLGDKLKKLASGLTSFNTVTDISSATSAMKSVASSAVKLAGIDYSGIAPGLKNIAAGLKSLSSVDTSGVEAFKTVSKTLDSVVSSIKKAASRFKTAGSDLMNALSNGIRSAQAKVINAITSLINKLLQFIKSKAGLFNKSGSVLMESLAKGMASQKIKVSTAVKSVVSSSADNIRNNYSGFYNAGSYLVDGFANGISANSYKAAAKAAAMATAAKLAAEEALGINSPSKEFYGIGKFTVAGFVNALDDLRRKVYVAGSKVGTTAKDGFSNSIKKLQKLIEGDMNTQPVIRPVLDLSDISAGAGSINNMLGLRPAVAVAGNVAAISSMMNNRQNGFNNDIVSAIHDLKRSIGNSSGDTYIVDGVTYDDGSNISTAVKEITRAAIRERRS